MLVQLFQNDLAHKCVILNFVHFIQSEHVGDFSLDKNEKLVFYCQEKFVFIFLFLIINICTIEKELSTFNFAKYFK